MISSTGSPAFHRAAISELERASTEATERSISAATITRTSGSAISATSLRSSEPVVNESVERNSSERPEPAIRTTTISPTRRDSQRPATARMRPVAPPAAGRASASAGEGAAAVSAGTACAPSAEGGLDAQREDPVDGDGDQQQSADRGLLPERLDLENDQRGRDGAQQQGAEGGSIDAAGSAEDRDATDDRRRDHGQL